MTEGGHAQPGDASADGYARLDLRVTPEGDVVFIEANPNPALAAYEDFSLGAAKAGYSYMRLIEKIIKLGKAASRS